MTPSDIFSSWMAPPPTVDRPAPICEPAEVGLSHSPWVGGHVVDAYYGSIRVEGWIPWRGKRTRIMPGVLLVYPRLQRRAAAIGGNYVLGIEIHFDPFATREFRPGIAWFAVGTVAKMRTLF